MTSNLESISGIPNYFPNLFPIPCFSLCDSTLVHNITQAALDALGWSTPLSADPPRALPRPIDVNIASQWINAHRTRWREAAKTFIEHIHYIPQDQFEEALRCTVADLNQNLDGRPYIVFGGMKHKSNRWVASLALKHLNTLPKDVIEKQQTSSDFFTVEFYENLEKMLNRHPEVRDMVLFDDAVYSGEQSTRYTRVLLRELSKHFRDKNFKLHIAIPYFVDPSNLKFSEEFKENVAIAKFQKLKTAKETIPLDKQRDFDYTYEGRLNDWLPIVYFDHKIPDCVSTYESQLQGKVPADPQQYPYIEQRKPPYKQ